MTEATAAYEQQRPPWKPRDFLAGLNKIAIYAATRGMPFLLFTHAGFLVRYVDAWLHQPDGSAGQAVEALFERWPGWIKRRIAAWLRDQLLPNQLLIVLLLIPFLVPLAGVVPWQVARSILASTLDVFRKGVRSVPALVTAVVVVFVTSDAWKILGNGFTVRFIVLIVVFVLGSLLFLVRWNCWDDLDATPTQAKVLLAGIRRRYPTSLTAYMDNGAGATPIVRPRRMGEVWVYVGYWFLSAF